MVVILVVREAISCTKRSNLQKQFCIEHVLNGKCKVCYAPLPFEEMLRGIRGDYQVDGNKRIRAERIDEMRQ